MKKNSTYALMGLIGGAVYGIADYLLFVNSNLDFLDPDPAWAGMSVLRFAFRME